MGGGGSGDVSGPSSSTDNDIAIFNGATGKIIKDSGVKTTDLVPYTGATGNVDLGGFNLDASRLHTGAGALNDPSLSFVGDAMTGIYSSAAANIDLTLNGTQTINVSATGLSIITPSGSETAPSLSFPNNIGLYSSGSWATNDEMLAITGFNGSGSGHKMMTFTSDSADNPIVEITGSTASFLVTGGSQSVVKFSGKPNGLATFSGGDGTLGGSGDDINNYALKSTVVTLTDTHSLTNQSADIADTAFAVNTAGLYRIQFYILDTTADLTAGAVTFNLKYTDDATARTISSQPVILTATTGFAQGEVVVRLNSGNITYGVTHTGIFGSAKYALYITQEKLI